MTKPRICLVSSSHPCCNPRLVKEADALHEAGFDVHAVVTRYLPALDALDREIFSHAGWTHSVVDITRPLTHLRHKCLQTFARRRLARSASPSPGLAALAHAPISGDLARAAGRLPADLYLGHVLAALPAVTAAAAHHHVKAGFDAEDFHSAELPDTSANALELKARCLLEQTLLPQCAHFTAASPLIAEAYRTCCGLTAVPVLNVFPRRLAPTVPIAPKPGRRPTLYWFSQTVGPDRGLEALIDTLALLRTECDVHLRGLPAPGFPAALRQRAQSAGWRGRLEFHPLASPDEMVRLAAGHTLGLSLEQTIPRNRDLCLTNKIFTYLLAGVPVLLTPTSAQRRLATDLGAAGLCLDFTVPAAAAARLDTFLQSSTESAAAAAHAGLLGRTRYNWDVEKEIFLRTIRITLNLPHP